MLFQRESLLTSEITVLRLNLSDKAKTAFREHVGEAAVRHGFGDGTNKKVSDIAGIKLLEDGPKPCGVSKSG